MIKSLEEDNLSLKNNKLGGSLFKGFNVVELTLLSLKFKYLCDAYIEKPNTFRFGYFC